MEEESPREELGRIAERLHEDVSKELTDAFESIAKIGMQAAALSKDPNVVAFEKIRNAQSSLVLIVEEAMRGMTRATRWAIGQAIFEGAKGQHDE